MFNISYNICKSNNSIRVIKMSDFLKMNDLFGGAFFGNVFSPKGAQKNSQKWGVWGGIGVRGLGSRVYI